MEFSDSGAHALWKALMSVVKQVDLTREQEWDIGRDFKTVIESYNKYLVEENKFLRQELIRLQNVTSEPIIIPKS